MFFGLAAAPPDVSELDPFLTSFRLDTLDGSRLGPPDLRGEVVVVDIWATWCKPCDVQAQILEGLHEEYADQGVSFLALNTGAVFCPAPRPSARRQASSRVTMARALRWE